VVYDSETIVVNTLGYNPKEVRKRIHALYNAFSLEGSLEELPEITGDILDDLSVSPARALHRAIKNET